MLLNSKVFCDCLGKKKKKNYVSSLDQPNLGGMGL